MCTILVQNLKDIVFGLLSIILFNTTVDGDNTAGVPSEDGGSNDDMQAEDINHHN